MAGRDKRDRGKEQFWRRMMRQWRCSGLSVRAFCAEHGLSEPSFFNWRRTIAERDNQDVAKMPRAARKNARPTFVPVRVLAASALLEVAFERGRVVRVPRGFDADTLRQLLAVLEERPC